MLRDCPCSTKTREVLGNPSPPPSRFPSTLEISLGLSRLGGARIHSLIIRREGFSDPLPVEKLMLRSRVLVATGIIVVQSSLLSLDTPTLEASPSGNLSGLRKSLGRRGWISQYLPRFGGARIHSLIISREGLILTLSILPCPQGRIF